MATTIVIDELQKSTGEKRVRSGVFSKRNSVNNEWVNVQVLQEIFAEESEAMKLARS
jgi:cell division protein FtsL